MNESKRYYWIKLKTDFFNQETIDFLLSQKNGCEYIVLYQMLCLNTANNNGSMCSKIGEMIVPYNVDKIVRDTKYFDFDTVTIALGLFKKLGLIYEEEGKILRINNFDEMVGSEAGNANAQRQKRFREKQKQLKLGVTNSNGNSNGCNVTKYNEEIEIEKDIEIRDKDIDKKKDIKKKTYYENDNLNSIFIEFLEVRKKLKAVNSDRAINTLLKTLSEYDDDTKYKMIENSIVNSWKSVYELKPAKVNASNNYKRIENVPEWLNKEIKGTPVSDTEKREVEELLKEFENKEFKPNPELQERLRQKYGKGKVN